MAGASTKMIQELIGHKDSRSTDKYIRIQRLFELRPLQARLALMYECPEVFDRLQQDGQGEKVLLQISDKSGRGAQKDGAADWATPRRN